MRPLFTSPGEWRDIAPAGERVYVRGAVGWVVRAGMLAFASMVLGLGAVDPYWRSLPIVLVFASSLGVMSGFSALLFRREWRAALEAYGDPMRERVGGSPPHAR